MHSIMKNTALLLGLCGFCFVFGGCAKKAYAESKPAKSHVVNPVQNPDCRGSFKNEPKGFRVLFKNFCQSG